MTFFPVLYPLMSCFLSLMLLLSFPVGAWAQGGQKPGIEFTTLASGQTVYVQENHTQPIVTIDTWINTGSAQETAGNNGVSHFLEHLLFKGTEKYQVGEIDRILESRGAEFNAATSDDFTHYHITTAAPYFQEALELHADMLLNATIRPEELARERKVVQEEINRALDNPGRKVAIALMETMFGQHPYAMDTLGPKANIQNLPREKILNYYRQWYQPENFKTVVVGDIETEKAIELVNQTFQKAFRSQERPPALRPNLYPVPALTAPKSRVLADPNLSQIQMQLGFPAPPLEQRTDNYALDVAAILLGDGASSRLYQRLKEERQLVNGIGAGNRTQQQAGTFVISAAVKPEHREAAKKAILEEIERFKQEGPTPAELEKAKTSVIKSFVFLNESTDGVAQSIGYNVTIGTLEDYTRYAENIQKITAEQVREAARKYLVPARSVLVEAIPAEAEKAAGLEVQAQQNVALLSRFNTNAGQVAAASSQTDKKPVAASPAVQKVVLPNGATLLLKPNPQTETVALSLFAKGGQLAETKPGLSALTARSLMKGTTNRTHRQLTTELESMGLSLGADSTRDYLQVTGSGLKEDFDHLLLILADVLQHPAFLPEEIGKERKDMLENIQNSRDNPSSLMFEKLTESLYRNHPYGAVGRQVESTLPGISRGELVQFYRQSIQPKNLVIAVVGNFNPEQTQLALKQILAGLPRPAEKQTGRVARLPEVSPLKKDTVVEAAKPEQAATWMAYGWLAPGISNSREYAALKLVNTMLGSGLSSRLFVNLREKQGLAYHVSTMYPSTLKQSHFIMYIGTAPENRQRVAEGFAREVQRLQAEPVTQEELEALKSKLTGQFALAHETNASQAFYIGLYETLGVGHEFDLHYPELIRQVTAEDMMQAARTWFTKPKVTAVVAPKVVRQERRTDASR